jgi:hypothetical protein
VLGACDWLEQQRRAIGVDDWLVGAIDGVRLCDVTLSAESVCATAGRTGC